MVSSSKCSFRPSIHTKNRMIERGISKEELFEGLLKGAKRKFQNKVISSFKGFEIVFRKKPCNYFIITVYWKKR